MHCNLRPPEPHQPLTAFPDKMVLRCVDPNSPNLKFVSAFGCLASFSNASGSKLSDVENDTPKRQLNFFSLGITGFVTLHTF